MASKSLLPTTAFRFCDALARGRELLGRNLKLIQNQCVTSESELLLQLAYERSVQQPLSRLDLYSKMNEAIPESVLSLYLDWCERRGEGQILQHLTGLQAFCENYYEVSPDVLIPRPETEGLVRAVIHHYRQCQKEPCLGLEIGLGSGVLSLELLLHYPGLSFLASELSLKALAIARSNASRILGYPGCERLQSVQATDPKDIWLPFKGLLKAQSLDFVISNPPYLVLPGSGAFTLEGEFKSEVEKEVLQHEPHEALFAPAGDPLFFYREIASGAADYLKPGGVIFVEIPHERSKEIESLFARKYTTVKIEKDLNGRDRVLIICSLPPANFLAGAIF